MRDTLKLASSLEAAGFTPKQAEGQASAMAEFLDQAAAVTKSDLQLTEDRLTLAMERSKNETLRWVISFNFVQVIVVALLMKYLR